MDPEPTIRVRAWVLGVLLCTLIGWWGPWGVCMLQGTLMFHWTTAAGAQFLLFVVVLAANHLLGRAAPAARLNTAELTLLAVMMILAASIPTLGLMAYLLPTMAGAHYYASAENRWADWVLPYLNTALVPLDRTAGSLRDQIEPIRQFFEGLAPGEPLPWAVWLRPLALYALVLVPLYLVMIALMVIARRPWIDNERLAYPIAQLPRELIRSADPRTRSGILRRPVFWVGVVLVFGYYSHRALAYYFPEAIGPPPSLRYDAWAFDRTVPLSVIIYFSVVGFAFLIDRRVALSLWLFSLVTTIEGHVLARWGLGVKGALGTYIPAGWPTILHQGTGALVLFVIAALWAARSHLRQVVRRALGGAADVDDSDEILSYRAAVLLLAVGSVAIVAWLVWAGLPLPWAVLFLLTALVIFLGLSRIVCESGMFLVWAPIVAPTFLTSGFGSQALGAVAVLALAACWPWCADTRTIAITSAAHGLRLIQSAGTRRRRRFFWAMLAAIGVTFVVSCVLMLVLAYTHGGVNLRWWFFIGAPTKVYANAAALVAHPTGPGWDGWLWKGIGAAATGVLVAAHRLIVNWPLHPVGFVLSHIDYAASMWASVFLAWAVKVVLVRWAGPHGFAWARPFFIGLILGEFSAGGFWLLVDFLTGTQGNKLF